MVSLVFISKLYVDVLLITLVTSSKIVFVWLGMLIAVTEELILFAAVL